MLQTWIFLGLIAVLTRGPQDGTGVDLEGPGLIERSDGARDSNSQNVIIGDRLHTSDPGIFLLTFKGSFRKSHPSCCKIGQCALLLFSSCHLVVEQSGNQTMVQIFCLLFPSFVLGFQ